MLHHLSLSRSKAAILQELDEEASSVVGRHLPVVAYRFSGGPWRNLWIRFGFDPRKQPSARIYQGIDFRVPHEQVALLKIPDTRVLTASDKPVRHRHAMRSKEDTELSLKNVGQSKKDEDDDENEADEDESGKEDVSEDEREASAEDLSFSRIPTKASSLYQLLDLEGGDIQRLLRNSTPTTTCTKAMGWYPKSVLAKIRNIMKTRLDKWVEEYLSGSTGEPQAVHSNDDLPSTEATHAEPPPTQEAEEKMAEEPDAAKIVKKRGRESERRGSKKLTDSEDKERRQKRRRTRASKGSEGEEERVEDGGPETNGNRLPDTDSSPLDDSQRPTKNHDDPSKAKPGQEEQAQEVAAEHTEEVGQHKAPLEYPQDLEQDMIIPSSPDLLPTDFATHNWPLPLLPDANAAPPSGPISTVKSVADFLDSNGLGRYKNAFDEEGYDDLEVLFALTPEELNAMMVDTGVKSGHQAKIRKLIQKHRARAVQSPAPTSVFSDPFNTEFELPTDNDELGNVAFPTAGGFAPEIKGHGHRHFSPCHTPPGIHDYEGAGEGGGDFRDQLSSQDSATLPLRDPSGTDTQSVEPSSSVQAPVESEEEDEYQVLGE